MTIRLSCPQGHSQDAVLALHKIGSNLAVGFLLKYAEEIAGLIDGTSKLYTIAPTPRRCQIEGCGQAVKAEVIER